MKKTLFATAFGLLLGTFAGQAQNHNNRETLEGNGNLVTREVPVTAFESLKASGVYELKLIQGSKEGVRVEADENLQDLITVRNDGSRLVIDMKKLENKNLKTKHKMRVHVTFRDLKNLDLSTVGHVGSDQALTFNDLDFKNSSVGNVDLNLTANKLSLENKSVGNVNLKGKAGEVVVRNKGVGSIEAGDFVVETMDIENNGVGSAEVNATKGLKVKDNMLGKVKNRGNATARKMNRVRV